MTLQFKVQYMQCILCSNICNCVAGPFFHLNEKDAIKLILQNHKILPDSKNTEINIL